MLGQGIMAVALGGIGGPLGVWMVRVCPPETRFSSVAVGYNMALAVFGGTAPLAGAALMRAFDSTASPGEVACTGVGEAWLRRLRHSADRVAVCELTVTCRVRCAGAYMAVLCIISFCSLTYSQAALLHDDDDRGRFRQFRDEGGDDTAVSHPAAAASASVPVNPPAAGTLPSAPPSTRLLRAVKSWVL